MNEEMNDNTIYKCSLCGKNYLINKFDAFKFGNACSKCAKDYIATFNKLSPSEIKKLKSKNKQEKV